MTSSAKVFAPPYHVQATAKEARGGFPYFPYHGSVSALWAQKWRKPCVAGIYPFTDADVADLDPIFEELVKRSNVSVASRPLGSAIIPRLRLRAGIAAGLCQRL